MNLVIIDRSLLIDGHQSNLSEASATLLANLSKADINVAIIGQVGEIADEVGLAQIESEHAELESKIAQLGGSLGGIFYCSHRPEDNCYCLPPAPGLLEAVSAELDIATANSPLLSDNIDVLQMGYDQGCEPVLVSREDDALVVLDNDPESDASQLLELPKFETLEQACQAVISIYFSPQ